MAVEFFFNAPGDLIPNIITFFNNSYWWGSVKFCVHASIEWSWLKNHFAMPQKNFLSLNSSIANEVIKTNSNFLKKRFGWKMKNETFLPSYEVFLCKKLSFLLFNIFLFLFYYLVFTRFVFFVSQKFFLKKWVCPNSLIYYATDMCLPQLPYGELFSTNLGPAFLPHSVIFICVHLFLFVTTSSYLS